MIDLILQSIPQAPFENLPARFRWLHQRDVAQDCWVDAWQAMAAPAIAMRMADASRCVLVAQQAVFAFDAIGRISISFANAMPDGSVNFQALDPDRVSIDPLLHRWIWLDNRRSSFAKLLHAIIGESDDSGTDELQTEESKAKQEYLRRETLAYSIWLFTRIRRAIAAAFDFRDVREQVRAALALDPEIMQLARQLRCRFVQTRALRFQLTAGDYNAAVRHRAGLRVLRAEAPGAIALWSALMSGERPLNEPREVMKVLKTRVRDTGISECTWRLAITAGPRLINPLADFYCLGEGKLRKVVLDWLRVMDVLELQTLPPDWLIRDLLSIYANPFDRKETVVMGYAKRGQQKRFAHAMRLILSMPDQGLSKRVEINRVLAWISDTEDVALDAARRHGGWKWLVQRALEFDRAQQAACEDAHDEWEVPIGPLSVGQVSVTPIASAAALRRESTEMSHCAFVLLDELRASTTQLLCAMSVSERSRTDRVTVMMRQDKAGWYAGPVAGFANRKAPAWAKNAAHDLARVMTAQCGQPHDQLR